ncbi:MAG: TetR/AcrR family transcriptional regulator [Bacteroidales bacterium]|nr:TetR/AcrR family transcriptional regulator [Bacteroidales bacterium]
MNRGNMPDSFGKLWLPCTKHPICEQGFCDNTADGFAGRLVRGIEVAMSADKLIKAGLANSFIRLLEAKPVDSITIAEITDGCGLNRRTFYNYFKDKNDLVEFIFVQTFEAAWTTNGRRSTLSEYFANIQESGARLSGFFLGNLPKHMGRNTLLEIQQEASIKGLLRLIEWNGYGAEITPRVVEAVQFYVYGILGISMEEARSAMRRGVSQRRRSIYLAENAVEELVPNILKKLLLTQAPKA